MSKSISYLSVNNENGFLLFNALLCFISGFLFFNQKSDNCVASGIDEGIAIW